MVEGSGGYLVMSVYKRGNKWYIYITYPDGKRFRKSVGTKKEAEKIEQKVRSEILNGKWDVVETKELLFNELVEQYLEYAKASKAESSYHSDVYRIRGHLLPHFGNIPLKSITPQMADEYKAMRVNQGAAPKTVNHDLINLSHMLKMAIRWGYLENNPASSVVKLKVPKNPPKFLSQDEIQRLIEAAKYSHIYPLIITALHTGMRKAELLNLKWSDIDYQQGIITIQNKTDWHTKNYKPRMLQMTPFLCEILKEHKSLMDESGFDCEYVFTYKGERILQDIRKSFGSILKASGLKNVTLHVLRHTFASQLAMAGVPLMDVQALMGHQSFETTLQYAHLSDDHVKKQVLKLPFANG
jgi:integrase